MGEERKHPPRFDHGAAYAQGMRSIEIWKQTEAIVARGLAALARGERVVLTAHGEVLAEFDPVNNDATTMRQRSAGSLRDTKMRSDDHDPRPLVMGASVGEVDRRQAGILPTRARVTDEMVARAQQEGADHGQLLDERLVRAMLEAALRG